MGRETNFEGWGEPLTELLEGVRNATRALLLGKRAADPGAPCPIDRAVARGAGDWTFGLDFPSETWIDGWFLERAREGPLSLLTEDRGWRHAGPTGSLHTFDHGGPRIAIDPVDGTRNLMADLRSAWTVVSFAGPGPGCPRLAELSGGIVAEIPTSDQSRVRTLIGDGHACILEERSLNDPDSTAPRRHPTAPTRNTRMTNAASRRRRRWPLD